MSMRARAVTPTADRAWVLGVERLAYTLLETARIRCEYLVELIGGTQLRAIHREIGLAGYQMSSEFAPELRERSLAIAHEEWEATTHQDPRSVLETMLEETIAASDAITNALSEAVSGSEQLSAAHVHVTAACDSLHAQLAERSGGA